ncbi:D-alanyl-D-alanine carboxypeptidase family protein [Acidithiobacillus sulfuriphilus]|uniref:serine-type D-Ala-D-Ala carboxypeptidase n=2 Tax=Acidithiobacillus sulfuriphilus TaxID=1867749 RepID=A0A3M8RG94_9PROT|nr:D-alanyl-D-alanine carboxypeptidase family protein [Acidithiobacillus sulfuriphilus]RNF67577.1 D-alanyl-D-alanine carboxypeptidase [Acidithiobacillus sulfuriphilus]
MLARSRFFTRIFCLFLCLLTISGTAALADTGTPTPLLPIPPAPGLPAIRSYALMDYSTGQVIAAKSEHMKLAPASLTKLMTAYLTYQSLQGGTLTLNEQIPISNTAWKAGGSSMFVQPGLPVTVDQLLHGLLIDSGNDAAVALAEAVGGSQSGFVTLMNDAAQRLGLTDTHYSNVDGLPDPNLYTSALDVALLSRALLQQYPQITKITVEKSYTYNKITQRSWNPVLFRDPTADGLKTGLTDASGYCIDATALRNGRRLIAVVMGGPSWSGSTNAVEALLDYGYRFFVNHPVYQAGQKVGEITRADLSPMQVPVGVAQAVSITAPKGRFSQVKTQLQLNPGLQAPVQKGQAVGVLVFTLDGKVLKTVPAVALESAGKAGWLGRLFNKARQSL